ncbi:O-methyltransferase [Cryptosporangium arvum]|uniref:O-methyltransferase n=1 Tax=Cryptosporangium arvum TaxID=80871 RepID=UPI00055F94B2|nr:O-methyltransferase [Cryptosporangium arvum]
MTHRNEWMPAELYDYTIAIGPPPDDVARDLIAETADRFPGPAGMQIPPEQAGFLTLITQLVGARSAVEVGTFTGFSSLAIARGLPADGRLLCLDVNDEWTSVAQRYWDRAGVADRIDLRIGPALEALRALPAEPTIDLVFIDADKPNYLAYWEELVPRVRPGGVLLIDNVFFHLSVLSENPTRPGGAAIRAFNAHVRDDPRVTHAVLPLGDGVTIARRVSSE